MTEQEWITRLTNEGFSEIYVQQDGPNKVYDDHEHGLVSAHVILDGEMTVTVDGHSTVYKPGDRFDISAKTVHAASLGPHGCRYLIGEKK